MPMRSEALDITIESRGKSIWMFLAGPFHNEQVPNIREKVLGLVNDGNRDFVIDLERITDVNDGVVSLFLDLLNLIRGKDGDLKLIFRNSVVSSAFARYRNLFSIYPNADALTTSGLLQSIRRQGIQWSRKTGIRLSAPVALFLLFVLCGWLLSLGFIIHIQNRTIRGQEVELQELVQWKQEKRLELQHLRERMQPLEQLGLLADTLAE
jgi:anti-anti-sigma regulatory factor